MALPHCLVRQLPLFRRETGTVKQVGTPAGSALDGAFPTPGVHRSVVAGEKDLWHALPIIVRRARLLSVLEQSIRE